MPQHFATAKRSKDWDFKVETVTLIPGINNLKQWSLMFFSFLDDFFGRMRSYKKKKTHAQYDK